MITIEDIEKLAQLARIEISDDEKESIRTDIESILEYVGQVKNTAGGNPGERAVPLVHNVMRPDVVTNEPGSYTEELLQAAPSREGQYFKVKKILQ